MLSIARRTAAGAALLLIMPLAVWVSGWQWQPGHQVWWLKTLFWITETVTKPWGVITHVILCGWFLWCLRFRLRAAIMYAVCDSRWGDYRRAGREVMGKGARTGAAAICGLA